jgi:hypothetical protein
VLTKSCKRSFTQCNQQGYKIDLRIYKRVKWQNAPSLYVNISRLLYWREIAKQRRRHARGERRVYTMNDSSSRSVTLYLSVDIEESKTAVHGIGFLGDRNCRDTTLNWKVNSTWTKIITWKLGQNESGVCAIARRASRSNTNSRRAASVVIFCLATLPSLDK